MSVTGFDAYFSVLPRVQSRRFYFKFYLCCFFLIIKDGLKKEFYGTTLPARLEKFEALLKSRDEGKGFFLSEKVR